MWFSSWIARTLWNWTQKSGVGKEAVPLHVSPFLFVCAAWKVGYNGKPQRFMLFFSAQRLHGFRQVVQHVSEHVAIGINWLIKSRKGRCCSGRKSKLVEDRYIVLCTVTLIQKTKQNTTQKQAQTNQAKNNTKHRAVTWQFQFMGEKDQLEQEVIA